MPLVDIFIISRAPCSGCRTAVYTFGRCTVRPSACVSLGRGECVRGTHVSLKLEMRTPLPFDRLDLLGISESSQCKGWFLFRISQNFGRYLKLPNGHESKGFLQKKIWHNLQNISGGSCFGFRRTWRGPPNLLNVRGGLIPNSSDRRALSPFGGLAPGNPGRTSLLCHCLGLCLT